MRQLLPLVACVLATSICVAAQDARAQDRTRDRDRPVLGVYGQYFSRGFRIDRLEADSQAERLGLQVGDYVVVIDGRPVGGDDYTIPDAFAETTTPRVEITVRYTVRGRPRYFFPLVQLRSSGVGAAAEKAPLGSPGKTAAKEAESKERPRRAER